MNSSHEFKANTSSRTQVSCQKPEPFHHCIYRQIWALNSESIDGCSQQSPTKRNHTEGSSTTFCQHFPVDKRKLEC